MLKNRKYKHKAKFTCVARAIPDTSKQISKASLQDLSPLFPDDWQNKSDLLPFAANVCVVNLGNKNGDLVDTEVGLEILPCFEHKYLNLEHDTDKIVGHFVKAAPTKFDSNFSNGSGSQILDKETIKGSYEPFNIGVGGYIYAAVFSELAKKVVESNDPDSEVYLKISLSWEIAFDSIHLQVGSKDRSDAEIISDPEEVEKLSKYLKGSGEDEGTGHLPDGREVYRLIVFAKDENGNIDKDSVWPLGAGLVLNPAGEVKGIVIPNIKSEATEICVASMHYRNECPSCSSVSQCRCGSKNKVITKELCDQCKPKNIANENNIEIVENNISQIKKITVSNNSHINMKVLKDLTELTGLNDETVKEYSVANIKSVVQAGLDKEIQDKMETVAKDWQAKVDAEKNAFANIQKELTDSKVTSKATEDKLKTLEKELADLKETQEKTVADQKFNERMASFDEKFELTPEDRKVIARQVRDKDETEFQEILKDLSVILAHKDKTKIEADKTKTDKEKTDKALAGTSKIEGDVIPNAIDPVKSTKEKYAKAFSVETVKFSK